MGSTRTVLLLAAALAVALFAALWLATRTDTEGASAVATSRPERAQQALDSGASTRVESPASTSTGSASIETASQPASAPAPTPHGPRALAGALRVEVFDLSGVALEGLAVFARRGPLERVEQLSDSSGLARFAELEAGAWSVLVGDHERPLAPASPIEIRAGADEFLRVELSAPLTEVEVEVVDEAGRPAPGVELKTRCERGGVSRAVTDHAGRARLRHVSLGVVRVFANDERLGRGNRALEIGAGERPSIVIALATRDSVR